MAEPVTLAEARAQVNIIDDADTTFDAYLTSLIAPARAYVEHETRWSFVAVSQVESFSRWDDYLESFWRPVTAVSVSYTDTDGNSATYAGARADLNRFPLRIYPAINDSFPGVADGGAITVTLTLGAIADTSREYLIGKRAMLLLIGHWFEYREGVTTQSVAPEIAFTIKSLLDELRPVSAY